VSALRTLFRYRQLIWSLTLLDFKIRHAGSKVGLLWTLLAPALILANYLLVFGGILHVQSSPGFTGLQYGFAVACGLLPWIGFSQGITSGTGSVLAQRSLMKSHVFPVELLPITAVCSGMIAQLWGTLLLLVVLVVYGSVGVALLVLPLLLLLQALLTVGLVWFLSCVNIVYRDTSQVLSLLMVLLMFVSPIAYTAEMVPARFEFLMKVNPLSYLIGWYRDSLLLNHAPNWWAVSAFTIVTLLAMQIGYMYFMRLRKVLPDYA
jgi:homopolymeric O-antigen transport system permease protein